MHIVIKCASLRVARILSFVLKNAHKINLINYF